MGGQSKRVFNQLYKSAKKPEDLPWHEADPPKLLVTALAQHDVVGKALDVGCGSGNYSIYMAERGYQVTAIDFMPQAVTMLEQRIAGRGLAIEVIQADVGLWQGNHLYDLVLDVGCLHTPGTIELAAYKKQLLSWLAPGGAFILLHFGRRAWWDWWPMGPKRVYADTLRETFAPECELMQTLTEERRGMPLVVGRSALISQYWFRRTPD